jgi:predicted hotdog family 3-hydroxylacyl-ACP dehydratase
MKYIPQKPPFELIDELMLFNNDHTVCSFVIPSEHVLVYNGFLTTAGLIENMAQTAACGVGYHSHLTGKLPPIGYIGAIKDFKLISLPKVGSTIITKTQHLTTISNVQIVRGEVFENDNLIASAEYKIFLQEEIK